MIKSQVKIRKSVLYGLFVYCIFVIIFLISNYSENMNKVIGIGVVLLSIIWIYKCWNNTYLLIMSLFIAYSNYSIVMGIYLDVNMRPSALYPQITDIEVYGIGIAMVFLTMLMLIILTPKYKHHNNENTSIHFIQLKNKNNILFMLALCMFLIILFTGYTTAINSRGTSSPLYEYASIFLIVMFYYSGNQIVHKVICIIVTMAYSIISLANGTRIEALICILIFVLCFFRNGLQPWVILVGMIGGLVVFSIIGTIRGNWLILTSNWEDIVSVIFKNKFVFDTCTHAYFPMLCMIEKFKTFSFSSAWHYLSAFILTVFLGQSRINDGNLINVVARYYYHNYGGVTIGFFYVWFSYIGSIIFSFLIYGYINFISKNTNCLSKYKICASLYFVASVPRWYLYGPWSLFRGVLVCLFIFWGFSLLNHLSFRKIHINNLFLEQ